MTAIADAAPQAEWIDITKRKPKGGRPGFGVEVLVWPRDFDSGTAFYGTRFSSRGCFYKYGARVEGVTHWMPLPEGPKAMTDAAPQAGDAFERWWYASKYCQVVNPEAHWRQIAMDGWSARAAEIERLTAALASSREMAIGLAAENETAEAALATEQAERIAAEESMERAVKKAHEWQHALAEAERERDALKEDAGRYRQALRSVYFMDHNEREWESLGEVQEWARKECESIDAARQAGRGSWAQS